MPRKKQVVQTQKRRKAYSGGAMSAEATNIKRKGAFRFFTNYKIFAIIGVLVMISGFGITAAFQSNGGSSTTSSQGQPISQSTAAPSVTAEAGTPVVGKQYAAAPKMAIDATKTYTATIKTDKGDVVIELLAKDAPTAVNNFVFLARDHFYDGTTFDRVLPDANGQVQIVQAGDPTHTGTGGPGYSLDFNPAESAQPFTGAVLAMAKPDAAGAANNGSQFFITLNDQPTFDGKNTVFGKVLSGADVLAGLAPREPGKQKDLAPATAIQSIAINEQ
jgi:cyclophilin family peptidyl-prolyl cis-trans isomerase